MMRPSNFRDFNSLSKTTPRFIIRGVVAPHGSNYGLVGQYTYLHVSEGMWPMWDGEHKAAKFENVHLGLEFASRANGPLFRMPSPETIEAVRVAT